MYGRLEDRRQEAIRAGALGADLCRGTVFNGHRRRGGSLAPGNLILDGHLDAHAAVPALYSFGHRAIGT